MSVVSQITLALFSADLSFLPLNRIHVCILLHHAGLRLALNMTELELCEHAIL
jgi:hypothetical protein